jgi:hypothetical protein
LPRKLKEGEGGHGGRKTRGKLWQLCANKELIHYHAQKRQLTFTLSVATQFRAMAPAAWKPPAGTEQLFFELNF